MKVKRRNFSDTATNSPSSNSTAETVGAGLGGLGLGAGVGYVSNLTLKNLDGESLADKMRWKRHEGKKGETILEERSRHISKHADKVEKAAKRAREIAKKKKGKAAMIVVPGLLGSGVGVIKKKKKKQKNYSESLIKNLDNEKQYGEDFLGILPISRFIDRSRFIGKNCIFKVVEDNSVLGNGDSRSMTFWTLTEKFEPTDKCPKTWKSFTISGTCKNGETMDANVMDEDGHVFTGRVMIKVR